MLDIVLIGAGAMATEVVKHLKSDPDVRVAAAIVLPIEVARAKELIPGADILTGVDALKGKPSLAVECAGHAGLGEHGVALLRRGIDLLVASTGALADRELYGRLAAAAKEGGARMLLISGAVGGIDALTAAKVAGLHKVVYTSRKPPKSWIGTPAEKVTDLGKVTSATVLFTGPADEAARLYPQNANVAATIALAGIGFDKTQCTLIADPAANGNIHRIEANGESGEFFIELRGKALAANPKTSMLAALSVVRAIRNRSAAIVI
jgi:aspartate dehydrogenase